MPSLKINKLGEIIWDYLSTGAYRERERLHLGQRDYHHGSRYITWPTSLEMVERVAHFAHAHGLDFDPGDPQRLVDHYFWTRIEMSQATIWQQEKLDRPFPPSLTPFQLATADYAVHTHRCFIADLEAKDRRAAALGAVDQVDQYPCILVLPKKEREAWLWQIRAILPHDLTILDLVDLTSHTPEKSIWLVEYSHLEPLRFPLWLPAYHSIIVDHADFIKNPNSRRSQAIQRLADKIDYRFLLTDFPIDLSPLDLLEPLDILGKLNEFSDLREFLETASLYPLENLSASSFGISLRRKNLEQLYLQLRATCLVRRADDPGLRVQFRLQRAKTTKLPANIAANIKSDLRQLGLEKAPSVIEWLRTFLFKQTGKTLIVAHHNDVVEELSAQLGLPAIYGPISEKKRVRLWEDFLSAFGPQALILAGKAALLASLTGVSALVLAELLTTPKQLAGFANSILGNEAATTLPVYQLAVIDHPLDLNALDRLDLRLEDIEAILDRDNDDD